MCSGSEAGSYLRLIDFLHHSTLGLKIIRKKKKVTVATVILAPGEDEDQREDGQEYRQLEGPDVSQLIRRYLV
jgi:hypothetical protein